MGGTCCPPVRALPRPTQAKQQRRGPYRRLSLQCGRIPPIAAGPPIVLFEYHSGRVTHTHIDLTLTAFDPQIRAGKFEAWVRQSELKCILAFSFLGRVITSLAGDFPKPRPA